MHVGRFHISSLLFFLLVVIVLSPPSFAEQYPSPDIERRFFFSGEVHRYSGDPDLPTVRAWVGYTDNINDENPSYTLLNNGLDDLMLTGAVETTVAHVAQVRQFMLLPDDPNKAYLLTQQRLLYNPDLIGGGEWRVESYI